jgi:hypothetical protein
MARKRVKTISESETGENLRFHDNYTWGDMTKKQFVKKIEGGDYPKHHIRIIDWVETPVSNPDSKVDNNLD